jgi:hypothetical protein
MLVVDLCLLTPLQMELPPMHGRALTKYVMAPSTPDA